MSKASSEKAQSTRSLWTLLGFFGPSFVVVIAGFVIAYQFVEPAPPRRVVLAAGDPDGSYHRFAHDYRQFFDRQGISLEVVATSGSVENLDALRENRDGIQVAFVQSGVAPNRKEDHLEGIASLYFEPLWIFYRHATPIDGLDALLGQRIALGTIGSGTRALAEQLLRDNGVSDDNTDLLPIGGLAAARSLEEHEVDAAFLVASPGSPAVERLVNSPSIRLLNLRRTTAYTRIYPFLAEITLPEGVQDLKANLPGEDVTLLSAMATLVARTDLHPALVPLFLEAAREIHGPAGIFERPGDFPSPEHLDFPLNREARRYFRHGPSFLQRYLPFWAASLIDRMKVLLLPLLTLFFPLFKVVPPTYRWRMRLRIYRWYKQIIAVDQSLIPTASRDQLDRHLGELRKVEEEVEQLSVPLSFADKLYDLRLHIVLIREKAQKLEEGIEARSR